MRAWTSPGSSRKSTSSSALTPGKVIETRRGSRRSRAVRSSLCTPRCVPVRGSGRSERRAGAARHGDPRSHQFVLSSTLASDQNLPGRQRLLAASGESNVSLGTMMYDSTVSPASALLTTSTAVSPNSGLYSATKLSWPAASASRRRLGAVDRGDLHVVAGHEAGFLDGQRRAEAHLVVLGEDELDVVVVGLEHGLDDALALLGRPVGGLRADLDELGLRLDRPSPKPSLRSLTTPTAGGPSSTK